MQVSLQALRAFEAAARLESFKKAAEELALTPTTVSHHIANLEGRLGVSLFHRETRRITLTSTGHFLAMATTDGFMTINNALGHIAKTASVVRVTTTSSLAAMLLIPYQHEFSALYPTIAVEISTGETLNNQPYVIAIRLGNVATAAPEDIVKYETFDVFGSAQVSDTWCGQGQITIYTTEWKNNELPMPSLEAWLDLNDISRDRVMVKTFDQELFAIQQAIAEDCLVFCSTTLVTRLLSARVLKHFQTQPIKTALCYYIPKKSLLDTNNSARYVEWVGNLLGAAEPSRTGKTDDCVVK